MKNKKSKKAILIAIYFLALINVIQAQSPNVNNEKAVCDWRNGCDDPKACCKIIKGGETCENTTFYDADNQPVIKCSSTVTTNCIECSDLISNPTPHNIGYHYYLLTNYSLDYLTIENAITVSNADTSIIVFDFDNYAINNNGRQAWLKATDNTVVIYTANVSSAFPYYTISSLDSILINLDLLFGISPLDYKQTQILTTKWLNNNLKVTIAPNPVKSKYYIQTESIHPYLKSSNKMVLELYNATGQLISTQSISANDKLEFEVPKDYPSGFLIYKILLDNSYRTGKIEVVK